MFLDDLKTYLLPFSGLSEKNIGRDILPDLPGQTAGLFLYNHPGGGSYPASTRYVQIQCRAGNKPDGSHDPDDANILAYTLCKALDTEDEVIQISGRKVGVNIKRYPQKLKLDETGRPVYYFEVAFLGDNTI